MGVVYDLASAAVCLIHGAFDHQRGAASAAGAVAAGAMVVAALRDARRGVMGAKAAGTALAHWDGET